MKVLTSSLPRLVRFALGLVLPVASVSPVLAETAPWKPGDLVRHDPAMVRVTAERARWNEHLPAERPRLFYRRADLPALRERYAHATGQARKWFDEMDAA